MGIKNYIKKYLSLVTVLMMIFVILPLNTIKVFAEKINTTTIQILATTDLHGRFMSYEYASNTESDGGLTQISTLIKAQKAENENTIVIDNGDTIQGNYNHLFLQDEKNPMMLAMNEIGYDVFNLGNHEFNYGMDKLEDIVYQGNNNLSVLCANLYEDNKRVFNGYTVKELENGIKVAIIGVVTSSITKWDGPNLEGYTVTNPVEEVGECISEIKKNGGADVYVVSAHMGLNEEEGNGDSASEIAEKYDEVSAVIMGHSHERKSGQKVNNAILIQPGSKGADLGKIDITLERTSGGYIITNLDSKLLSTKGAENDEKLVEKLVSYHERAIDDATSIIGKLDADLADADEINGIPESIISDQGITEFVNEVQLYYAKEKLEELEVNLENVHLVSAAALFEANSNMTAGEITKADVSKIYKYDNKLYVVKTTGEQLKKFMEWTAAIYNTFKEGDLTVSLNENIRLYQYDMFEGINYDINISNLPGERIERLRFGDGTEVKDSDEIYLAVNNYRYDSVLNDPENPIFDEGQHEKVYDSNNDTVSDVRDLIIDYIVNVKDGSVERSVNNNWKLTGLNYDTAKREAVVKLVNADKLQVPLSEDNRTPNVRSITWDDVIKVVYKKVDIISFNDFHGSVLEGDKEVGAAKLATVIKEKQSLNSEDYEAFVVSAGDLYQGTAISNLTYGNVVSEFLNSINLTTSAIGNHEFDWGMDKISKWESDGGFKFLAANIVEKESKNQVSWADPYMIVESNGIRIGIIGITTEETVYKTNPENISEIEFVSPEMAVNKYAKKLKEEDGVNAVVVLSHLSASQDSSSKEVTGEAAELAKAVYNVDAIIAAHDHKFTSGVVNNIPVVQGGYNGRGLASLNFEFNIEGKILKVEGSTDEVYLRKQSIIPDEEVNNIITSYEEELSSILDEKISEIDRDLEYDRDKGLSDLGIVISETIRQIAKTDIAILNGGGIRAPLAKGIVSVGDLYKALPFDNTLVKVQMKGSEIIEVLEHGIIPESFGWGQFSGVKVWYDSNNERGNRITSIRLSNGKPLDMEKSYTVVINDYMLSGGDQYDFSNSINVEDTNLFMREAIMEFWKENGINTDIEELLICGEDKDKVIVNTEDEEIIEEAVAVNKGFSNKDNLPKTGGTNTVYIVIIAVIVIGMGIFLFIKKDKNKKDNNAS